MFAETSCSTLFSMRDFFLGFPNGFGLLADSQMGFSGDGIGFSGRRLVLHFDLLITGSLPMNT